MTTFVSRMKGNKARGRQIAKHARLGKYSQQFARTARNRIRKLKKHLKRQPNDSQAKQALL